MMSGDIGMTSEDDITILHDLQLHDEDGNPYPAGSPPQYHILEGSVSGTSAPPDTAGSTVALKTAYDHVRNQNDFFRKQNDQLKALYKKANDKVKQMQMIQQATPVVTMHSAAASGNVDRIPELLETGIDVNTRNPEGRTALHTAAISSQSSVCSLLLHAKADPNAVDNDGRCPIHMAARNGDVGNSKLLIEFGADVNTMDRDGRTPLHVAAANGHPEICKVLIEAGREAEGGLEINQTDLYGQTPLSMAKLNTHQDVFKVLEDAGGILPVVEGAASHLRDVADDVTYGNNESAVRRQMPKLIHIIQSLYQILGMLISKVDVIAVEFPEIRDKIEKLINSSQNLIESSDESELNSIEQTVEGVIGLEEWLNQRPQSERSNLGGRGHGDGKTGDLERELASAQNELSHIREQLQQEHAKTKELTEKVHSQEAEIGRLQTNAENLDLYSATNLGGGEEEGELYDIGQLFSKISSVERESSDLRELVHNQFRQRKGSLPRQVQHTRQASSLPSPARNQTTSTRQSASLQAENGNPRSRNILQLHDIRLPRSDFAQHTGRAQVIIEDSQRQAGAAQRHGSTGHVPPSPRRQESGKRYGPDSWPQRYVTGEADLKGLSQSNPERVRESGTARQTPNRSPGFVPRSPSRDVNQPFDSVRGPPAYEYSSAGQTRYVEGASQGPIFEDGMPPRSPRRSHETNQQRYVVIPGATATTAGGSAQVQNAYPVSCSDERRQIGSRDQIVIPGREPQEGNWDDQGFHQRRDELATGVESIVADEGAFETLLGEIPKCPVCGREFAADTPADNMNAHVNRCLDGGGPTNDFEVLPSQ